MKSTLLGGLTPAGFLRRHWQKEPLFVRGALPDCGEWLTRAALFEWATRDNVESRLVMHSRGRWQVEQGPFPATRLKRLPARGWSLLVQGVEQHDPRAARLLQAFSFIPHARLDDLMVSYAPPGGGVGPHFDSYDVFLLQGKGKRRWRLNAQRDLALVEGAPLRILKNFRHTQEWITRQGDLLYLPPCHAHDGVALEDCMTLSVGFRAPRHQELAQRFLEHLQDGLSLEGLYEDRGLRLQRHPGELSKAMLQQFSRVLARIAWRDADVRQFAGRYLTEPKDLVVFATPRTVLTLAAFAGRAARGGVRLALASRMLFRGREVFINGEMYAMHTLPADDRGLLMRLANRRELPPGALQREGEVLALLYGWYRAGYVEV